MSYSHIKQTGLLVSSILLGVIALLSYSQSASSHSVSVDYAAHGLRAYIDPDTGQFGPVPDPAADRAGAIFSAQTFNNRPGRITLTERASSRAGGGFTVELREQYRPSHHGSQQGS